MASVCAVVVVGAIHERGESPGIEQTNMDIILEEEN